MELKTDRSASNGKMDVTEYLAKLPKPIDEIPDIGKILSAELRKITSQKLTQWQLLRLLVDHIENQSVIFLATSLSPFSLCILACMKKFFYQFNCDLFFFYFYHQLTE